MRYGEDSLSHVDHSRLERIVCAGEVLNPHAWDWLQNRVLGGRVPVLDHMWQTETGGPAFGNPYGVEPMPIKPGSATIPLPGIEASVVTMTGEPCAPNEKGIMVLTRPFPGMTPALWGEPERYQRDYWQKIPGVYYSGDSTYIDEDGYYWFCGRADEVIKIAAHRIGTIEVESAFITHPAVAECGVVGRPDETRGEVISAFVVLKHGHTASDELRADRTSGARRRRCRRRAELRRHAAKDAQRQDHAPRAEGCGAQRRSGRHHYDRGRRIGRGGPTGLGRFERPKDKGLTS
jgi:acetyl-CoA synthetase